MLCKIHNQICNLLYRWEVLQNLNESSVDSFADGRFPDLQFEKKQVTSRVLEEARFLAFNHFTFFYMRRRV